ncbi:hypothetical protein RF11_07213 [Thelohanellus kitauei]|uniref:Uncharacterized protein n=1 Tax=Thelohanellus kitauei TaxID=669202 RepID=A0A0C2NHB1_THEKT|nr:hypothetical protein RF11_07213 [Thelohanellus kitauei]
MYDVSVIIAKNLNFDMTRVIYVSLDKQRPVSKCRKRLRGCRVISSLKVITFSANSHTTTSTSRCCLEYDRISILFSKFLSFSDRFYWLFSARNNRHPALFGQFSTGHFVTHHVDYVIGWSNKSYSVIMTELSERTVFGQKPVSGMDAIFTNIAGQFYNFFTIEVGRDRILALAD